MLISIQIFSFPPFTNKKDEKLDKSDDAHRLQVQSYQPNFVVNNITFK